MSVFTYDSKSFYLDGKDFRILSGAIHYFRVFKQDYRDRLEKLRACGLNTVETYCAWNILEPTEGNFEFDGLYDLAEFLDTAASLGLKAIVRPGPYICAEWDFGGLPAWLVAKEGLVVRTCNEQYLFYVRRYFTELFKIIRPRLLQNGGNVILLQVENEYGSYGSERQYVEAIRDIITSLDMPVTLFTSDGPTEKMLKNGALPDMLATVNFGSRPAEAFELLKKMRPDCPLMCTEFWDGWFDHWGDTHHIRDVKSLVDDLDTILSLGGSVNFYMFCGGTNFGFMNGANYEEQFEPTITSYDYDALLDERGGITPKYLAVREVIEKYFGKIPFDIPADNGAKAFGRVEMTASCGFFDMPGHAFLSKELPTAEQAGCLYGYALYSCDTEKGILTIDGVRDRAYVFINEMFAGIVGREDCMSFTLREHSIIDILVDNLGRINFGSRIGERKGIIGCVTLNDKAVTGWRVAGFGNDIPALCDFEEGDMAECPAAFRGRISIDKPADTFLRADGFSTGVAFCNGFCLGRYRAEGPQRTLYIPSHLLHGGENEFVVFECEGFSDPAITLTDKIDLG